MPNSPNTIQLEVPKSRVAADLHGTDLSGANLEDADLEDADLKDADLRGTKHLTAEQVRSAKNWRHADLPEDLQYLTE